MQEKIEISNIAYNLIIIRHQVADILEIMISFRLRLRLSIILAFARVVAGADEQHQIDVGMPLYPEGITYEPSSDTIILGSLAAPVIVTLDAKTFAVRKVKSIGNATYLQRCFGLYIDSPSSRLWCSRTNILSSNEGAIVSFDLADVLADDDGLLSPVGELPIPPTSAAYSLDVVVASGTAYATDSRAGSVASVGTDFNTIEIVASSPLLKPPPGASSGANGIEYVSGDTYEALIVANYGNKTISRVDVETGETSHIATLDSSVDGLVFLRDGRLAAVTYPFLSVMEGQNDWREVNVTHKVPLNFIPGEIATTVTLSDNDLEVFVTFVRFGELLAGNTNSNSSLVARVSVPPLSDAPLSQSSSPTNPPTSPPTNPPTSSAVSVAQTFLLTVASLAVLAAFA